MVVGHGSWCLLWSRAGGGGLNSPPARSVVDRPCTPTSRRRQAVIGRLLLAARKVPQEPRHVFDVLQCLVQVRAVGGDGAGASASAEWGTNNVAWGPRGTRRTNDSPLSARSAGLSGIRRMSPPANGAKMLDGSYPSRQGMLSKTGRARASCAATARWPTRDATLVDRGLRASRWRVLGYEHR